MPIVISLSLSLFFLLAPSPPLSLSLFSHSAPLCSFLLLLSHSTLSLILPPPFFYSLSFLSFCSLSLFLSSSTLPPPPFSFLSFCSLSLFLSSSTLSLSLPVYLHTHTDIHTRLYLAIYVCK